MTVIIKFNVSGTAQNKGIALNDDEIVLSSTANGSYEGNSRPIEPGKALLSYWASGPTAATLKVEMTHSEDKVDKSVPSTSTVIDGAKRVTITESE